MMYYTIITQSLNCKLYNTYNNLYFFMNIELTVLLKRYIYIFFFFYETSQLVIVVSSEF